MKKYIIAAAVILAVTSGCQNVALFKKDNKKEVYEKWHKARAEVVFKVAKEHLKVGELDQAHSNAARALALDENFVDARMLLGKVCIEQGRYQEAIEQFEQVKSNRPNSARVWYLLGVAQEKADNLQQAIHSYRQAYALDNRNMDAVHAVTEVLVAMGRIREAQLQVESHISQADDDPSMYELGGRIAMMRDEYDSAAEYYSQACDLDPENVGYLRALAKAEYLSGRYEEARRHLDELAASADSPAWVFAMLGDCHMATGEPIKARNAYQKAVKKRGDSAKLYEKLARAELACGDLEGVVVSTRKALSKKPANSNAAMLLGYALLKTDRVSQADEVLNRTLALGEPDAPLLCLLGMVNTARDERAEAARCYAKALEIDPDSKLARALLDKLRQDDDAAASSQEVSMAPLGGR